jgi:hypothetical protein
LCLFLKAIKQHHDIAFIKNKKSPINIHGMFFLFSSVSAFSAIRRFRLPAGESG